MFDFICKSSTEFWGMESKPKIRNENMFPSGIETAIPRIASFRFKQLSN